VSPIVGGQIDAIGFVVAGYDHAADIENGMLADELLIDAQNVGRCCS